MEVLPGFRPAVPMVFAGLYPLDSEAGGFDGMAAAMDKLALTDASVLVKRENSDALGPGFRCGFLGALHMEVRAWARAAGGREGGRGKGLSACLGGRACVHACGGGCMHAAAFPKDGMGGRLGYGPSVDMPAAKTLRGGVVGLAARLSRPSTPCGRSPDLQVVMQRLEQEYGAAVVTTTPTVPYRVTMADGREWTLERASDFPLDGKVHICMHAQMHACKQIRADACAEHAAPPCAHCSPMSLCPLRCLWQCLQLVRVHAAFPPPSPLARSTEPRVRFDQAVPSADLHACGQVVSIEEPTVNGSILLPAEYTGRIIELCQVS